MEKYFGTFLLKQRIKQGLSQQDLADFLGYTNQTISNFERDKAFPDLSIWSKYASVLNLDLESFIFAKENKNNDLCSSLRFDKEKFAKNLKYLRKKNNLTQIDLSKMIQVNSKTIMSYENGKTFPSLDSFVKLCNLYKLKVDELYFVINLKDDKSNNEKPIKKKRIFVPIILPILIVTTVTGVGVGVTTNAIRNRNNHRNEEIINNATSDDSLNISSFYQSSDDSAFISSNEPISSSNEPISIEPANIDETNITYDLTDDVLTINNIDTSLTDIVIPEIINNHIVNKIDASMITSLEAYKNKTLKRLIYASDIEIEGFEDITFNSFGLLESITLPKNIERLAIYQFNDCHLLKEIDIPSNVKIIEGSSFSGCSNLKRVNFASNSKLEAIDDCAFRYCYKLEDINIPHSVTLLNDWAFQECNALKEIQLPDELLKINNNVFFSCVSLISIEIPKKVNTIGIECFQSCKTLESIYIPSSVTYINHDAFSDCPNLTIYCEMDEKPDAWHDNWNSGSNTVIWGYNH